MRRRIISSRPSSLPSKFLAGALKRTKKAA
jgi:hypothetical protein